MMEMENINKFLEEPSIEKLEKFRKNELIEIGEKLELEVRRSMRKNRLISIIAEHMVDEDIFEGEILEDLPIESTTITPEQIELEKSRIQAKLELQKVRLEQETRRLELELMRTGQRDECCAFDITKQARLVPKFMEENPDEYFTHLKRTAMNLGWPKKKKKMLGNVAADGVDR